MLRKTQADARGDFRLEDLPPGNYVLTASAPGFAEIHSEVGVAISSVREINVTVAAKNRGGKSAGECRYGIGEPLIFLPHLRRAEESIAARIKSLAEAELIVFVLGGRTHLPESLLALALRQRYPGSCALPVSSPLPTGVCGQSRQAIGYFQAAIEKDPRYALAYAGLADSYLVQGWVGELAPKEIYPQAREAALKALDLDDTLAEAHNALATVKRDYDWDWSGAERQYKRAIDLTPSYANAHQWYGELLMALGRSKKA